MGPFVHYPGTSGYQNYTLWTEGRVQYVKTNYQVYENKLPVTCSYKLNNSSWTQITSDLGNGCGQISIPKERFSLQNTLEFSESSNYKTRFSWTLYIPIETDQKVYQKYFTHDISGNMTSAANCYGTVSFEYGDEYNAAYVTGITDPLGNTVSAVYDDIGNIVSITDARGYTYQYEYDLLGRLRKKINPDLTEREAVYDNVNNTVIIYDELDHFVKKYFDRLGRLTKTENALSTEIYTYNYLDQLETKIDPQGLIYTYEYDVQGRITNAYNPDGTFIQWVYNNLENTVEISDENLHKTGYKYDWAGNLLSVKEYMDQGYNLTEYQYDEFNNLIKVKDAKGNTTSYEYGLFGIERILYPDSTEETLVYDCIGNVIQKISGQREIHYQYNTASQLIRIDYPDSFVAFTYDENGNRTTMEDSHSSAVYVYDSRNRLTSETKTIDGIDYTTSYTYDEASRVVSITYPDGTSVTQDYDNLNRLISVDGYAQFVWNANSQLQHISYQNGTITDYLYDVRGRPIQIETTKNGSDLLNLTYAYDVAGNILQIRNEDSSTIKEQWDYTYDPLNRLTSASGGPSGQNYSLNYQYDSTGNRIQLNSTVYTYNNMNELLSLSDGSCTFTYDGNGNCVTKNDGENVWEYAYDCENRLVSVKKNGQTIEEYVYDGDGKRIKKIDADSERIYIYGGLNVLYEVNITTQMDAIYLYGPTGKIAKKVNDITDYYHTDHLGSTRLVTSENGTVTEEIQYEPFGEQISTSEEKYTFNGKERDETGLYYYGARYYDPSIGRFISKDPLTGKKESPQTLNRYTYCLNNPLTYVDPAGTEGESAQQKVEQVFGRLKNVNPNDLAAVQALIDSEKYFEALVKILELLGFEFKDNGDGTLTAIINGKEWTMKMDNNLTDPVSGLPAWGLTDPNDNGEGGTIFINFGLGGTAADMTLTVLHEVSHVVLGCKNQEVEHKFIYGVEYSYMMALNSLGVGISDRFWRHMVGEAEYFDPSRAHRVRISEILSRWVARCRPC